MRSVVIYKRFTNWSMGIIYGSKVVRQAADYLGEHQGLKLCGFYEYDGKYNITEAHSGYRIVLEDSKEKAMEKLNEADFSKIDIKRIKKLAHYYGMSAMHSSYYHIIRDNTLIGDKRALRKYYSRGGK
ncbi:hypothetical protein [Enterococcus raffinosus]|uniref:Uncharacterized protein n=1 Tax=Enterococcus raffinosus ATCC 49464 TaxID=1158602 RepID=R2NVW7_9ENTE|nr:hypothetical protein [Enterococcus raffinosus]EOH76187.1 hypothetical protein UAK_03036 [Enterococcus raffinosus ATCC 49464]EOT76154.1 hypothetical protein I590_02979 [Enterococcus raffinosus ATCC 49464]UXK02928.1 hypothetical protein N7K38_09695 [Enterococcus raffinosus]